MTKGLVHFRNFANAPKNWTVNICFIMLILISFTFNRIKRDKLIGIIISYTLGFFFLSRTVDLDNIEGFLFTN